MIKLDENLPSALAERLREAGFDVETVADENMSGTPDPNLLQVATAEQRILLTFDLDFADIRTYPPGSHTGIVVFRLRDQRWATLREPTERLIASGLLNGWTGGLAIVDEKRTRLRNPPS
jgi:predicted nuclease of predicted toxin-antitoxin system